MTTTTVGEGEVGPLVITETVADKGLKTGALGLISSVVMGVASTAPAYSLAATLGLVVLAVGVHAPMVALLAFVPMLCVSVGYSELNKADPDCGTIFTWGTRTFGPRAGWYGGWGLIAADVLVMASLAQVAGQYVFLFFNTGSIGNNPASGWVLLVGLLWLVAMTYICYRGIEVSAAFQRVLLSIEIVMLLVLSATALIRVAVGHAPTGHLRPSWGWFNIANIPFNAFVSGLILMLFIYWGWDTAVSVNEETADSSRVPGLAAILSTLVLLVTYVVVILAALSFAGVGTSGIGLANPAHVGDVLSVQATAVFGSAWVGSVFTKLLLLMVLSSAAASTQTTILPTARTTLSMAAYKALPKSFARVHPRYLTPTVSTIAMGGISFVLYLAFNYMSNGFVIPDAVTAIGVWIAFYYGLTGFTCAWYYRKSLLSSARDLWMKGIIPLLGGLILYGAMGWSLWQDWNYNRNQSFTSWRLPFPPHSQVGGVFVIVVVSAVVGVVLGLLWRVAGPSFFRGETLNRSTPTLVPEPEGDLFHVPVPGEGTAG
ncbi:MAG TPA: APC family permease, partial [Acidimicrobiales bacterium]|nr:APC family permease [Acidimicrobiales bacterium]